MKTDSLDASDIKYIPEGAYEAIKRYTISSDDVYISIAGTIGLVGKVPEYLSGSNLTENAAKVTELDASLVNRDFLIYFFSNCAITPRGLPRGYSAPLPEGVKGELEAPPFLEGLPEVEYWNATRSPHSLGVPISRDLVSEVSEGYLQRRGVAGIHMGIIREDRGGVRS